MGLLVALGLRAPRGFVSPDVLSKSKPDPKGKPSPPPDGDDPKVEPSAMAAAAGGSGGAPGGGGPGKGGGHGDDPGGGDDDNASEEEGEEGDDEEVEEVQGNESGEGEGGDPDPEPESEADDDRHSFIVELGKAPGWADEKRAAQDFPPRLFVYLGGERILETTLENVDLENWKMREPDQMFLRLGETRQALLNFIQNPPEPDSDSSFESEEEPILRGPVFDRSYAGDTPPPELKLPKPYVDKHDGLEHRFRKVKGAVFGNSGEPDPDDVVQGVGNCYFMASLAALAGTAVGRQRLAQLMAERPNSGAQVEAWLPTLRTQDGMEVLASAGFGAPVDDLPPLWPALLEQAFAAKRGGYNEMDGGAATEAFDFLGIGSETIEVMRMPAQDLKQWFLDREGCAFVLGTPKSWGGQGGGLSMFVVDGGDKKVPFAGLPIWGLPHIICWALGKPARPVQVDADGKVSCDGRHLGHLLDEGGSPPAGNPRWMSARMEYAETVEPASAILSCKVVHEALDGLATQHEYAVVAVSAGGVTVRDTQAKTRRELSYVEISRAMAWASAAGKLPQAK